MTILTVESLSKKFAPEARRGAALALRDIAGELLAGEGPDARLRAGEFWALDAVSFTLRRGEALAVVGHNGAGKSTLLRMLCGLLKPDSGKVTVDGRVQAIIELGNGLFPNLTGRENVATAAALAGLGARERPAFEAAVRDFAEIGDFLDAPFHSYSSGMKARLSFALSAHLAADLILVDEVLAVGDSGFQHKCIAYMRDYLARGGALIFVSHSPFQIQRVCERGLLLERGRKTFEGSAVEALGLLFQTRPARVLAGREGEAEDGPVRIDSVRAEPVEGDALAPRRRFRIVLSYTARERVELLWGFSLWTQDQWVCIAGEHDPRPVTVGPGAGELRCLVRDLPLVGGRYLLRAALIHPETRQPIAMRGYQDAPEPMVVEEPAAYATNLKMADNQLVHLEVEW
ncbi:MAG: ABC transporter ATP-binding protein [Alphaproteobacteria bacterium]|nr:ABC transporter ATP-binding protein [Alphaproteobacteria bacterium]MBV9371544.1 ABC transporter ATP-binding protein [Alphaproteobacteria bacterium]MBV9902714.1 ABC transporter ATP-binding protein [Alphaproteobacteria bacterium]